MNQPENSVIETGSLGKSFYQICIDGHLDERWLRYFDGLTITQLAGGETVLAGEMDQAALHGTLNRIRDLSLVLISVRRIRSNDVKNMIGDLQ